MSRASQFILAFVLSLCVFSAQLWHRGVKAPEADEIGYLLIAQDLNTYGVFGNGLSSVRDATGRPESGRFFAPAYPVYLHLLSQLDPATRVYVDCPISQTGQRSATCQRASMMLLAGQIAMAGIGMVCIFAIALMLSSSPLVAWFTLGLALASGEPGYYARTTLTENIAFMAFYLFLAASVWAMLRQKTFAFAAAGAALALATLSRPSYIYVFYAALPVLAGLILFRRKDGFGWSHLAVFVAAMVAVLLPYLARNMMLFGEPSLVAGYGGFILAQRVAYNAMSWQEWGAAFIYWLPDFGPKLAKALFRPELYTQLNSDDPNSYFWIGNGRMVKETLAASGGPDNHLSYLMRTYVLGDLFKHLAVTIPLTLRGLWAGKYLALTGAVLLISVLRTFARRGQLTALLALALPTIFMAGLHGAVSVNVVRYNVPIIALAAFVIAFTLAQVIRRFGWPKRFADHLRSHGI